MQPFNNLLKLIGEFMEKFRKLIKSVDLLCFFKTNK